MGPKRNHPNYKNEVLLAVISEVLPAGAQMWEDVASQYQIATGEIEKRDADVIKRHFNDKLCNGNKKPTGNSGDARNDLILRAQRIKLQILQNQAIGNVGSGVRNDEDGFGFDNDDEDADDNEEEDFLTEVNDFYGNEFQATQAQADAAIQGGTTFGIVPNGPPVGPSAPKRQQVPDASAGNKTKSMKQSPRQTAGGQIAALGNTLQTVAESSYSAMMMQMMMQQNQQMQQQMQQQSQQSMQMMMMMMGMMRSNSPILPPHPNAQAFTSPPNHDDSSSTNEN